MKEIKGFSRGSVLLFFSIWVVSFLIISHYQETASSQTGKINQDAVSKLIEERKPKPVATETFEKNSSPNIRDQVKVDLNTYVCTLFLYKNNGALCRKIFGITSDTIKIEGGILRVSTQNTIFVYNGQFLIKCARGN